jgi:hypothetical protein
MHNHGIQAKWIVDDSPQQTFLNLANCESRQENSIDSRLGPAMITTNGTNNTPLADTNIHTLKRLKSTLGNTWRYAGAGTNLYRRTGDTNGAYGTIASGLNGARFSADAYSPALSNFPYLFIADKSKMLKDNGTGNAQNWGGLPPTVPPTITLLQNSVTTIDTFITGNPYTNVNVGAAAFQSRVNTTVAAAVTVTGVQAVTPAAMTNIMPGMQLLIDGAGTPETVQVISITATTFTANFTATHLAGFTVKRDFLQGTVAANTVATVSVSVALNLNSAGGTISGDTDFINLFVKLSDPNQITEMRIFFDVGDGSFTQSFYMKAITPSTIQPMVSGNQTANQAVTARIFARAGGQVDSRSLGNALAIDILPVGDPIAFDVQPGDFTTGLNQWSLIQIQKSGFVEVGLANTAGHDWSNVNAWRIQFQTTATGTITFGLDDFYLLGGSGLTSFGGVSYDYRYTYYNINTGYETNPSISLIQSLFLLPLNQPIKVTWTASSDPQFTHVRVYRRGGSLPQGWNLVATVPIGTTTFTDTLADSVISINKTLEIDNDPPVTSTTSTPINTTLGTVVTAGSTQTVTPGSLAQIVANQLLFIGSGANQEAVRVQSINSGAGTFTAFFQNAHSNTDVVSGNTIPNTPMNLFAVAFDTGFLAGDPNNTNILYFSKRGNIEAWPPQNQLPVGKPDDPIMAIVNFGNSLLYILTLSRIYSAFYPEGASQPQVYQTRELTYGLVANFGWTVGNGEIKYQAADGIRRFRGGASELMTLPVDWLETGQTFGPIVPQDVTQLSQTLMEYFNREMYVSYIGQDGLRHRLIWNDDFQRFRNDDIAANALFVEQDTKKLLYADTNGNIFQDRVNNFDDGGFVAGVQTKNAIPMNMQTPYLDQGKPKFKKVYQEFMIDIDTQGETVTVQLLFDNGLGPTLTLGTVTQTGRAKVLLPPINGDKGQEGYNVSLKVTGNVKNMVTIREWAVKGVVETDLREAFDSYWQDTDTPEWKLMKQGWFNYTTTANQPITVNRYVDGDLSAPEFTFTLPATTVRQPLRVRMPSTKCRMWRITMTAAAPFRLYNESFTEVRNLSTQKGYGRKQLQAAA